MIDRIRLLLKEKNLNAAQFADLIGVQRSSISHVLSGRNKPSLEFIQKILKVYPDISSDWLISGKGEVVASAKSQSVDLFTSSDDSSQGGSGLNKARPQTSEKGEKTAIPEKKKETALLSDSSIERVIIFYKNGKMKEYKPE